MALVDEIERLGSQVEAKEITREDAIDRLSEWGLARLGAADVLDRWKTVRTDYEATFRATEISYLNLIYREF